jgi:hypothetical protein
MTERQTFFFPVPAAEIVAALGNGDGSAEFLLDDDFRSIETFLSNQQLVSYTDVSDGAGAATIAHGIDMTSRSVLGAWAFFDNTGITQPCDVGSIDATNVTIAGGGANNAVRVTLLLGRRLNFL